jgi:hypothetical protein
LRRDALTDFAVVLVLMTVILVATAGLGVVALLEIPAAALVTASYVAERRRRGRKGSRSAANRPRPR